MLLKIILFRVAARKRDNSLPIITSVDNLNVSVPSVYRSRRQCNCYVDPRVELMFDPDDDGCSWQSVYFLNRCPLPRGE